MHAILEPGFGVTYTGGHSRYGGERYPGEYFRIQSQTFWTRKPSTRSGHELGTHAIAHRNGWAGGSSVAMERNTPPPRRERRHTAGVRTRAAANRRAHP